MKPDYKNWVPKGMLFTLAAGTGLAFLDLLLFGVFGVGVHGGVQAALGIVCAIAFLVCAWYTRWGIHAYNAFSYDGERKLPR